MNNNFSNNPPGELPPGALCPGCNYDLRGVKVDGVCPECGFPVSACLRAALTFKRFPHWPIIIKQGARAIQASVILTLLIIPLIGLLDYIALPGLTFVPAVLAAACRTHSIRKLTTFSADGTRWIVSPLARSCFILSAVLETLAWFGMVLPHHLNGWVIVSFVFFTFLNLIIQALCIYRISLIFVLPKAALMSRLVGFMIPITTIGFTLLCLLVTYVVSNFVTSILLLILALLVLGSFVGLVHAATDLLEEMENLSKLYSTLLYKEPPT